MILALDIGNTNIEIGLVKDEPDDFNVIASARYYTNINVTSDQMAFFILEFLRARNLNRENVKKMIFSSVVPPLNNIIIKMYNDYFTGVITEINSNINLGIINCYKNPAEVGSDRLVNASAAYHIYKENCIIADIGTATTLCVVTDEGKYLGGSIFTGILTSTKALTQKAAKLPSIKLQKKDKLLAEDTASAIESGMFFSYYYALKGMIKQLAQEVNFTKYISIGTGGFIKLFEDKKIFDNIEPLLTLKGLKIINDLNN